jgi:hypothetical protein
MVVEIETFLIWDQKTGLVFERVESDLAVKSIRLENVSGYRYLSARSARQPDTSSLGSPEKSLKRYSHVARSARFLVGSGPFWCPNELDYAMYQAEDI